MLFYFLISIVFIAELIIAFTIIIGLLNFDKSINLYNSFIEQAKPDIKDIMLSCRKLSEQLIKLAPIAVNKIKAFITNLILGQLKSALGALTFWMVKKEVEKHV